MTDEEKIFKASHFENIDELIKTCKMWIQDDDWDAYCRFFDMGAMEELINLIEKQQKEIEKQKEKTEYYERIIVNKECEKQYKELYQGIREIIRTDYIGKDKIKAKIEEYEQDVKDFEEYWSKDPRKFKKEKSVNYYKLEALKELLEKEQ